MFIKGENMYQVYIKKGTGFDPKHLIGEFRDFDKATERVQDELAKDPALKYIIEETTGRVDNYGELVATVVEEN